MFVKSNKNVKDGKVWYTHHIVESRRVKGKKYPTHQYLANITALPDEVVEKIRALLQDDLVEKNEKVEIKQGDALRGAGQIAIRRVWKKSGVEKALVPFSTKTQRDAIFVGDRGMYSKSNLEYIEEKEKVAGLWNSLNAYKRSASKSLD